MRPAPPSPAAVNTGLCLRPWVPSGMACAVRQCLCFTGRYARRCVDAFKLRDTPTGRKAPVVPLMRLWLCSCCASVAEPSTLHVSVRGFGHPAVGHPLSAVGRPPTAVGCPPTAVGCPPTAVGCPPTAVCYPPSAVGCPPTAVGYPPTAVGHPSTAVGRPPTPALALANPSSLFFGQ